MTIQSAGRVNQKARTRAAIVRAVQDLARDGAEITMPSVARAALVSEATAYRYFPDLVSLLLESMPASGPTPPRRGRGIHRPWVARGGVGPGAPPFPLLPGPGLLAAETDAGVWPDPAEALAP